MAEKKCADGEKAKTYGITTYCCPQIQNFFYGDVVWCCPATQNLDAPSFNPSKVCNKANIIGEVND